jgi:hypothetical protein
MAPLRLDASIPPASDEAAHITGQEIVISGRDGARLFDRRASSDVLERHHPPPLSNCSELSSLAWMSFGG